MFNISFGEIAVVAVIGLIVIGPRRLPETARFLGHLASRVQRQVAEVKSDIRREMDLEDLKQIQREYEGAAREMTDGFNAHARELRDAADAARGAADDKAEDERAAEKTQTAQWPGSDSAAADNGGAAKKTGEEDGAKDANPPSAARGAGGESAAEK